MSSSWFNLSIGKWKVKYIALSPIEKEYPYCDINGNVIKKVSGKFEKGYFIDEVTGNKFESAYKLINGKASEGFKGRIKEVAKYIEVDKAQADDILTEKEYLVDSEELYNELLESGKALLFGGWFGNGYKAYKVYLIPSELYKGYLTMKCGTTKKSELMNELVGQQTEDKRLQEKLKAIELTTQKVNKAKIEDLIEL